MSIKKFVLFWIFVWDPAIVCLGEVWRATISAGPMSPMTSLMAFYVFAICLFLPAILYLVWSDRKNS